MVKMENGLPETNTAEEAGQQVAGKQDARTTGQAGQPTGPAGPLHG